VPPEPGPRGGSQKAPDGPKDRASSGSIPQVGPPVPNIAFARGEEEGLIRKSRPDALGALLSVSFLSCLFVLLLVAEQAFPPAPSAGRGIGLDGGVRGPLVVGGPAHSALAAPPLALPPVAATAVEVLEPALLEPTETQAGGAPRERRRADRPGPSQERDGTRTPRAAAGPRTLAAPGASDEAPGHARNGGGVAAARSNGSGHGSLGTPPGHGGTPPGHVGEAPGHAKAKGRDHGPGGRGKGRSKHQGSPNQRPGHSSG
jgi:hypothetical protein